jgi:outer membrane protein assembly factor BamB
VLTLILALGVLLPPDKTSGDWPQWRGPNRDGVSPETNQLREWPEDGPPVLWKVRLGGGFSSVAVARGRVFVHTAKDKKEEIVLCLDAATGDELWRYAYPCDYNRAVTLVESSDSGPRATPAVDGDCVYTIGTTGIVLCLASESGKKIWEADLRTIGGRTCPPRGYCSSPLVVGDHVYVHPGGAKGNSIVALNKKDGSVVWTALDDPIAHATPTYVDAAGKPQVIYFTGRGAVAVAPKDGKLLWRYDWRTEANCNCASPIHHDGRVFISSATGSGGALLKLNDDAGPELVWKNLVMQNQYSTSVLVDGHLYGFSNTRLRCVEFATGKAVWDQSGLGKGTLLAADGMLVLLGEKGNLVLAEATPKGYRERGRCKPLDGVCLTAPALAGGRLFVRNENLLVALDVTGKNK